MRRKLQVKGYTRTTGGKSVKVKPHSRMGGKEGVHETSGRGEPGEEYQSTKARASADAEDDYKPGKYAYDYTAEEWAAMAEEARRKRDAARGPKFRKTAAPSSTETKSNRTPHKYSSLTGVAGRLNQIADKMLDWADRHLK